MPTARARTRRTLLISFLLASVTAIAVASPAKPSLRSRMVVTTAWLAQHLHDPSLVLLHVGNRTEYDIAHLPGARFVALSDISTSSMEEGGLHLEMLSAGELRERLEALGISDNSRIVVYWGKDWFSPTTRVLFTLATAGLGGRSSLLDGGQGVWAEEGRPLTAELPADKRGSLASFALQPAIVDAEFVRSNLSRKGFALVDGRSSEFYDGSEAGGSGEHPHRRGHIAGAFSLPFDSLVDGDRKLLPEEELRRRFHAAGIQPGDSIVTHCHIGQQATVALYAARTLGYEARLYDGSFEEWSRLPAAPVDDPTAAARANAAAAPETHAEGCE